ncbi:MAG: serine/threonine protein kinase, partial [Planctomycetota bacterium]
MTHPNVVTVHEAGELSGFLYFSMDYVAGPSLAQLLKTRVLPLERALEIALGVCEGLGAAHEAGLVHRDLKPANVLLDPRGVPRITDFGIAKDTTRAGKTLPGELLGTPSYMSPEQADGRSGSVDARADLYALGAILYRVLTGSPPFTGQSNYEILQGILKGELVPPRKLVSELPPSVDALVVRCLARRPEDRFPSAAALAAALRQALAEVGGGAPVRAAPPSPAKGWG